MKNSILTICIPTYNRKESAIRLVKSITSQGILSLVDLIVVDDGSIDGTYNALELLDFPDGSNVRLIRQENKGLANTFLDFFSQCRTEYLMLVPDDDMIVASGVNKIIDFLLETKSDLVVAQWLDSDGHTLFKGKSTISRIKINEIRLATNHATGIVYRVETVSSSLTHVRKRLMSDCYATCIFPQVILVLFLSIYSDDMFWFPYPVGGFTSEGALPSQLRDNSGNHWSSLSARWSEQKAFAEIYLCLIELSIKKSAKSEYEKLLDKHNIEVYSRLRSGLSAESSELLILFDGGAMFNCIRRLPVNIKSFIKYLRIKLS